MDTARRHAVHSGGGGEADFYKHPSTLLPPPLRAAAAVTKYKPCDSDALSRRDGPPVTANPCRMTPPVRCPPVNARQRPDRLVPQHLDSLRPSVRGRGPPQRHDPQLHNPGRHADRVRQCLGTPDPNTSDPHDRRTVRLQRFPSQACSKRLRNLSWLCRTFHPPCEYCLHGDFSGLSLWIAVLDDEEPTISAKADGSEVGSTDAQRASRLFAEYILLP